MNFIRPYIPKVNLEELARAAPDIKTPNTTAEEPRIITPANIQNPEAYLILEGRTHGNYSYPDLLVSMHRLELDNQVKQIAKQLNLTVQNTAKEKDGTEYIGNIKWEPAIKLTLSLGGLTLPPRQYVDFINLLKSGKAYNGKGDKVDKVNLDNILGEILTVRNPYRAEWLDAKFSGAGNQMKSQIGKQLSTQITYHKIDSNGNIKEVTEPLEDCLMQDKTPGIDLDSWLNSANKQGLPVKQTKSGTLWYWYPRENAVARFDADADRAYLYCLRGPGSSDSALGVFGCAEGTPKKIKGKINF